MYEQFRSSQLAIYNEKRQFLIDNPNLLIELEKYISNKIVEILKTNLVSIQEDYNEASYLYPFWQNYPPDDRGRKPRGDQFPWIEIGEHVLGSKLPRLISKDFIIKDYGIPTGPDARFILKSDSISRLTKELTDSCWVFIDIKSVGPRDDADHAVMSHNQISGDGKWEALEKGIINNLINAKGKRVSHSFYCAIPPIYISSKNEILPVVEIVIKPVYRMIMDKTKCIGQPLKRIDVVTIPNGILLFYGPEYLKKYPHLFFPGKDDKSKEVNKSRAHVSFSDLRKIDRWRVQTIVL
jgi:hypothetical protein